MRREEYSLDVLRIRKDFPILDRQIEGRPLIYLDNAATTQVPIPVMNSVQEHYLQMHGNVHRGIHTLSMRSTESLENARKKTAVFLHAEKPENIVFTQGTTAAINLIAAGFEAEITPEDEILVTALEHHSNFLPWQQLAKRTGAKFRVVPQKDGELDRNAFGDLLNENTKIVACAHVSNLTGTVNPVKWICEEAKKVAAYTVIDGAQAIRHEKTNVSEIECDFYCFSGHKMMAGTGIGVLYGKTEALEALRPTRFGGGMVDDVRMEDADFSSLPYRLEAGTGSFVQAIALGSAIDYICQIGQSEIAEYEAELIELAENELKKISGVSIVGKPAKRAGCISITAEGIHPYDLASVLDHFGVAARSGTHCALPALQSFGIQSTLRISPAFYNTKEEIRTFADLLNQSVGLLNQWRKFQ